MNTNFSPVVLVSGNETLQANTKRIYLIRHGHSGGTDKITTMDPPLSRKGIEQSLLLREYFKGKKIDEIITSELTRAKETAEITRGSKDIKISSFKELNELHTISGWELMSQEELTKVVNTRIYKYNHLIPSGETLENFHKRVESIWNKVILNSNSTNILLITHYEVMRVLISIFFKFNHNTDVDFLIAFPHTSLSEIRIVDTSNDPDLPEKMYVLQYLCKTDHLNTDLISY